MRISDWSSDVCSSDLQETISRIRCSLRTPVVAIGQQPKRIKNEKQRRALMGHDRRSYPEAHDRRRHEQGDDAQADDQILPDDPAGAAAEADRERQMREIVGHRRDIGGLERVFRSMEKDTSETQSL